MESSELKAQAKRLLSYRLPLILVIVVNVGLVLRIPLAAALSTREERSASTQIATRNTARGDAQKMRRRKVPQTPPLLASDRMDAARANSRSAEDSQVVMRRDVKRDTSGVPAAQPRLRDGNRHAVSDTIDFQQSASEKISESAAEVSHHEKTLASTASATPTLFWTAWKEHVQRLASHVPRFAQASSPRRREESRRAARRNAARVTLDANQIDDDDLASTVVSQESNHAESGNSVEEKPTPENGILTIRNPETNTEPVRFLVDGRFEELRPGESHTFRSLGNWHVQFHRGGSFDNADAYVTSGVYCFLVTDAGWTLVPIATN